MKNYVLKRLLMVLPVMFGVIVIVFLIKAITPGDPVVSMLGPESTAEERDALREELGLNDSLGTQFVRYIGDLFHLDLGKSYKSGQPIMEELSRRLPTSLLITFGAIFLGMATGVPLGVLSALKQYSWIDNLILCITMALISIPSFCLGLVLIYIFSVELHILPAFGVQSWTGYILPVVVISAATSANYARVTRSSMLEVIRQDYVRTARAKGQTERVIVIRHILRNALVPVVNTLGNQIGVQLGGAIVVETVFGIPGIGKYISDAIMARDYPVVQGGVLLLALIFTVVNVLIDLLYVFVDPRLKKTFANEGSKRKGVSKNG